MEKNSYHCIKYDIKKHVQIHLQNSFPKSFEENRQLQQIQHCKEVTIHSFHLKDKHIMLVASDHMPPTKMFTIKFSIYKAVDMTQSCENIHRIFKQEPTIRVCNVIIHIHGKIFLNKNLNDSV